MHSGISHLMYNTENSLLPSPSTIMLETSSLSKYGMPMTAAREVASVKKERTQSVEVRQKTSMIDLEQDKLAVPHVPTYEVQQKLEVLVLH